jgi:hypothetical protein
MSRLTNNHRDAIPIIDCYKPDFYMFNTGIRMIALCTDVCIALDVKGNVLSWGESNPALG